MFLGLSLGMLNILVEVWCKVLYLCVIFLFNNKEMGGGVVTHMQRNESTENISYINSIEATGSFTSKLHFLDQGKNRFWVHNKVEAWNKRADWSLQISLLTYFIFVAPKHFHLSSLPKYFPFFPQTFPTYLLLFHFIYLLSLNSPFSPFEQHDLPSHMLFMYLKHL